MKKILIIILIIAGIISGFISYFLNPKRIFRLLVLPEESKTIKELKHYADGCGMYGASIFAFGASRQDTQKIIKSNNLKKYDKIPKFLSEILTNIERHNLSWWKSLEELKQMEIYGEESTGASGQHLKFIFISKENHVYYLLR